MKKTTIALLLTASIVLATACGNSSTAPQSSSQASEPQSSEESSQAAAGKVIYPLEPTVSIENINDITVPVSFKAENIVTSESGSTITLTVYDNNLYDLVDMSTLEVGDTIYILDVPVLVETLERGENSVSINGGVTEGGNDFRTYGNGVYIESIMNDYIIYFSIGTVTLPVSENCIFVNNTDVSNMNQQSPISDFFASIEEMETYLDEQALKVRVENKEIVEVILNYVP